MNVPGGRWLLLRLTAAWKNSDYLEVCRLDVPWECSVTIIWACPEHYMVWSREMYGRCPCFGQFEPLWRSAIGALTINNQPSWDEQQSKANLTWSKRVFSQGMRHPSGSILTSDIQYHHASGGWIQYLRAHRCFTWNLFFSSSVFILKHDLRNPSLPGQVFISLEFRAHPSLIQVIYNCWAHGAGARHKKPF